MLLPPSGAFEQVQAPKKTATLYLKVPLQFRIYTSTKAQRSGVSNNNNNNNKQKAAVDSRRLKRKWSDSCVWGR